MSKDMEHASRICPEDSDLARCIDGEQCLECTIPAAEFHRLVRGLETGRKESGE